MSVLEAIQRSAEFLNRKGVESARLQAELLLAHVLRVKRMELYLNFERPLSEVEVADYREFVRRRGEREPLQHIVGTVNFCGLELMVNRNVLVPRPETEVLAEQGWKFLNEGATAAKTEEPIQSSRRDAGAPREVEGTASRFFQPRALDLGTGSGCLAIALAVQCPSAMIVATDVSGEALQVAGRNAEAHKVGNRISFVQSDGFENVGAQDNFDLIISNPPYIPSSEIPNLQPEVRDFDPRTALDGGTDGLDFYRRIAAEGVKFLEPGGKCMVEFGDGQSAAVREIFEKQKWIVEATLEDYTQRARIMIARGN